jgi:hypothetical protein
MPQSRRVGKWEMPFGVQRTDVETQNTKHQTPGKHKTPNIKSNHRKALKFDAWCFPGVWCLVLGV